MCSIKKKNHKQNLVGAAGFTIRTENKVYLSNHPLCKSKPKLLKLGCVLARMITQDENPYISAGNTNHLCDKALITCK